jgi:hypothetical protein
LHLVVKGKGNMELSSFLLFSPYCLKVFRCRSFWTLVEIGLPLQEECSGPCHLFISDFQFLSVQIQLIVVACKLEGKGKDSQGQNTVKSLSKPLEYGDAVLTKSQTKILGGADMVIAVTNLVGSEVF